MQAVFPGLVRCWKLEITNNMETYTLEVFIEGEKLSLTTTIDAEDSFDMESQLEDIIIDIAKKRHVGYNYTVISKYAQHNQITT